MHALLTRAHNPNLFKSELDIRHAVGWFAISSTEKEAFKIKEQDKAELTGKGVQRRDKSDTLQLVWESEEDARPMPLLRTEYVERYARL